MEQRTALLLGATGLVGTQCLNLLLEEPAYNKIHAVVRRPFDKKHPKLEIHVIDFANLEPLISRLKVNDLFCCLGSTLKQAGSKKQFRKIDYEFPLKAAEQGLANSANQFLLVSSMGANPRSLIFYNQVKGEIERAISALPYQSISIFRPSFLLGERTEHRAFESIVKMIMTLVSPLMVGWLRPYRAIEAKIVARAMVQAARKQQPDVHIFDSAQIQELGQERI